jgi:hypothetical protein
MAMAQRVVTELTDDLDGSTIPDGAGETVSFALDKVEYEIDLSDKNAAKLRKALRSYVDAGRRLGAPSRRSRSASQPSSRSRANGDARAIRAWAVENGIELSARGRIPAGVVEQYHAAN